MSITQKELIRNSALYFHDKTAVVYEGESLTFGEVNQRANCLANALNHLGLQPGDRVATLMRNCLHYTEIVFGLMKGRFPQVTLNTRLLPPDLAFQICDSEVSAIIVQHLYGEVINSIRDQLVNVKHVICLDGKWPRMLDYEQLLFSTSWDEPEGEINLDEVGEIHYTGGTTGSPKGVMLPYRNKLSVTRNILLDILPDMTSDDKFVALQPLYHGAGWFILPVWVRGATQFIVPRFEPQIAFNLIEKKRITVIKTVPTVILRLLDSSELKRFDLSSIKTIVYGAEPMSTTRLREAITIFGPVFAQIYGQMEAAASICALKKEDHVIGDDPRKCRVLSSVGRPMTFVQVRIVNENGKDVPIGEMGEIVVKGDHQMIGYLKRPEATAEKIRNGWIYTGDLGTMDENGYVYLSGGRKSEMVISGGLNIYPAEVEQVLCQLPAVAEAAVIGIPDPQWGESVKACVVLKKGHNVGEQEIIDFCKDRMASYKKPRSVDFLKELPRTGVGKVAYSELRKRYK